MYDQLAARLQSSISNCIDYQLRLSCSVHEPPRQHCVDNASKRERQSLICLMIHDRFLYCRDSCFFIWWIRWCLHQGHKTSLSPSWTVDGSGRWNLACRSSASHGIQYLSIGKSWLWHPWKINFFVRSLEQWRRDKWTKVIHIQDSRQLKTYFLTLTPAKLLYQSWAKKYPLIDISQYLDPQQTGRARGTR